MGGGVLFSPGNGRLVSRFGKGMVWLHWVAFCVHFLGSLLSAGWSVCVDNWAWHFGIR